MRGVLIKNLTRRRTPQLPFRAVAANILPGWDISLVFVGEKRARSLNIKLRKKDYVPNVLSYQVGKRSCEIFICLKEAGSQAASFQLQASSFKLLLFIHALLHIKGLAHGVTMEKCERDFLARYGETTSDRHRYRHLPGKAGGR